MLELKKGIDILSTIGAVKTIDEARAIFEKNMDAANVAKISKIKNEEALLKVANAIAMCQPKDVKIITNDPADKKWVKEWSKEKGEEKSLAMKDHTIHFDLAEDQARLVKQTFYIVNEDEKLSALAKKELRSESFEYLKKNMTGIMKDKIMMVGFFSRGPIGAKAAIPAIEISSSTYVLHSGDILYRNCFEKFDAEAARYGLFLTNVHCEGANTAADVPNARIYMDRSWLTTFSTFCTYAGNTLLLKKGNHRFAVDLATYMGVEKELSEHMFLTGMTGPGGRKTYFAGAAPSGCGKTTTAMVGTDFIGDDLCQLWLEEDGTVRGINPEKGIFGIVADVNREGDPYLMKCLREEGTEVIWSNVCIDDKNVPHWVGNGEESPKKGFNFQGEWFEGKKDANGKEVPISHANSRCTLENSSIANYNEAAAEDPAGVKVKVVTYSGRDANTMPPVWAAKSADEGVAIGASIVSKATATEIGATGVNRQPWANAPFIPGDLADYMKAQFKFFNSKKLSEEGTPVMAGLNYFLTHEARGSKEPGILGEKKDVKVWLGWLELYAHGDVEAIETPIGFIPRYEDLNKLFVTIDKEYPKSLYDMQFSFYVDNIVARLDLQKEAYTKEGGIPARLFEIYDAQKVELLALKEKFGSVVSVEQMA